MGCGGSTPSTLTKEEVVLLQEKTKLPEDKLHRMHQAFLKVCPTGQLTRNQFAEIYKHMFPNGKSTAFFEHMFRTFDKDNSGTLSFVEFMLAAHLTETGTAEEILDISFRLYDIDGNQKIEANEIAEILKALYMLHNEERKDMDSMCSEAAKELIARMDTDNDGVLSRDEFINGCLQDSSLCKVLAGNQ